MAAKLLAFYSEPADRDAFDKAYFETHAPLAKKMPGLREMSVVKLQKNLMGKELPYYMLAELTFDSMDALKAALDSPEGKLAGANLMGFAATTVKLVLSEVVTTEGKSTEAVGAV